MNIHQTNDSAAIAKLNKTVHELHVNWQPDHIKPYHFESMHEAFQKLIANEKYRFFLIEDNEKPCGYLWIEVKTYPENAFKKSYRSVYVHQISLEQEVRGKGFGKALMDQVYDIARQESIDLIELDYWSQNIEAKRFYESQGFVRYHEDVHKRLTR